jgi:phage baseplate assembly protein W
MSISTAYSRLRQSIIIILEGPLGSQREDRNKRKKGERKRNATYA